MSNPLLDACNISALTTWPYEKYHKYAHAELWHIKQQVAFNMPKEDIPIILGSLKMAMINIMKSLLRKEGGTTIFTDEEITAVYSRVSSRVPALNDIRDVHNVIHRLSEWYETKEGENLDDFLESYERVFNAIDLIIGIDSRYSNKMLKAAVKELNEEYLNQISSKEGYIISYLFNEYYCGDIITGLSKAYVFGLKNDTIEAQKYTNRSDYVTGLYRR